MARTKQTARKSVLPFVGAKKTIAPPLPPSKGSGPKLYEYVIKKRLSQGTVEPTSFHPDIFGQFVIKQFASLWESKKWSDITILVGNQRIPCHKVVLVCQSSKFEELILNASGSTDIRVDTPDTELFLMLLLFMYKGQLLLNKLQAKALLELAHQYCVESLKDYCGSILAEKVTKENVHVLLELMRKYNCAELRKRCSMFIARRFERMVNDESIMNLEVDIWEDLLKCNVFESPNEEFVYEAVLKYTTKITQSNEDRLKVLERLLPLIRYAHIDGKYLVEKIEGAWDFDFFPKILYEAYQFKTYDLGTARKVYERESLLRLLPRVDSSRSRERLCIQCGQNFTRRDNNDSACNHHVMNCTCPVPQNWYDPTQVPTKCCCMGCGSVCTNCSSCKCGAPCQHSRHKETSDKDQSNGDKDEDIDEDEESSDNDSAM